MTLPLKWAGLGLALGATLLGAGCGGNSSRSATSTATPASTQSSTPAQSAPRAPHPTFSLIGPTHSGALALSAPLELAFSAAVDSASLDRGLAVVHSGQALTVASVVSGASVVVTPQQPTWPADATLEVEIRSPLAGAGGERIMPISVSVQTALPPSPPARPLALPLATGPRSDARSVVLADGRALTVGGQGAAPLASADLFDPDQQSLRPTASLAEGRYAHTLARLRDGRVLVVGGVGAAGSLASAELFDPARERWLPAGDLAATRVFGEAFTLPSGRVVVLGGFDSFGHGALQPRVTAEVFDPRANAWSEVPNLRFSPGDWAQLADGRLLHLGAPVAIYDFEAQPPAMTPLPQASFVSRSFTARTLLATGELLIAGGASGFGGPTQAVHAEVDLFDPASNTFQSLKPLDTPRWGAIAQRLADERIAVIGGAGDAVAGPPAGVGQLELYDARSDSWTSATGAPLDGPSALALDEGGLLITGGRALHVATPTGLTEAMLLPSGLLAPPAAPHVVGVGAQGGRGAADPRGALTVRFSLACDPGTLVPASFELRRVGGGPVSLSVIPAADALSARLVPSEPLAAGADYELEVLSSLLTLTAQPFDLSVGAASVALRTRATPAQGGASALLVVDRPSGGPQRLYALADRDLDGDFDDADETTLVYEAAAGVLLQEPAMNDRGEVFLPDSSGNQVLRLVDLNGDGDCMDAGESNVYYDDRGILGPVLTSAASVALGPDGALYVANNGTGAGGADAVIRMVDLNGDGDALDLDEASVFGATDYAGALWGLKVDPYGVVWHTVTGSVGNLLIRLEDLDGDGDADDAGESSSFSSGVFITDVAFDLGFRAHAWSGFGFVQARLQALDAGALSGVFSNPNSRVAGANALVGLAGGDFALIDDNGASWRLRDTNGDGDYDDADELSQRYSNAANTLLRPFSACGALPAARPLLLTPPQAGASVLSGVAQPNAVVLVEVAGSSQRVTCDPEGRFDLTLAAALKAGDQLTLASDGLAGRSAALSYTLR